MPLPNKSITVDEEIYFLNQEQAWCAGASIVGGKAAQLGLLARYGLPVPKAYAITADHCKSMLPATLWQSAITACDLDEPQRTEQLSIIRKSIQQQQLPLPFVIALEILIEKESWQNTPLAIRSSAPSEDSAQASFAGIHLSELNVIGVEAITQALLAVCASLWTPQAVAYRHRIELAHQDAAMAIVIMPMLRSIASGVVFTCDPRSGREDHLVISSVRGYGEALVSGLVSSEDITLERDWFGSQWKIIERHSSTADIALEENSNGGLRRRPLSSAEQSTAILSDQQAMQLAALAFDAATAFNYTQISLDIEWVWDGEHFHLVQARPITAKKNYTYPELANQAIIWTKGNTKEILPTSLKASEIGVLQSGANIMLSLPRQLIGLSTLKGGQRIGIFNGHAYLNASLIQWEIYEGFGISPAEINSIFGGHQDTITLPPTNWRRPFQVAVRRLLTILRYPKMRKRGMQESRHIFHTAQEWRQKDLNTWDDKQLIECFLTQVKDSYQNHLGLCVMQGASGTLIELLKLLKVKFPVEANAIVGTLVGTAFDDESPSVSAQQGHDLLALAKLAKSDQSTLNWLNNTNQPTMHVLEIDSPFTVALNRFLDLYGHRGIYESYLSNPSWRENLNLLKQAILGVFDIDATARQHQETQQQQQAAQAWQRIAKSSHWIELKYLKMLRHMAKVECDQRELARSSFILLKERSRKIMLGLAKRLLDKGIIKEIDHIFHLTPIEIQAVIHNNLSAAAIQARIQDRIELIDQWNSQNTPDVILQTPTTTIPSNPPSIQNIAGTNTWSGMAVSLGTFEGPIKIITHPNQYELMKKGDIMVAPATDPAWLPLFLKASAVIVETGGYLSHSAIVAREFGIPCIVNLPGIMNILHNDDIVHVDGQSGLITRISSSQ